MTLNQRGHMGSKRGVAYQDRYEAMMPKWGRGVNRMTARASRAASGAVGYCRCIYRARRAAAR